MSSCLLIIMLIICIVFVLGFLVAFRFCSKLCLLGATMIIMFMPNVIILFIMFSSIHNFLSILVLGVIGFTLQPLWPDSSKMGMWFLSVIMMVLLGVLIALYIGNRNYGSVSFSFLLFFSSSLGFICINLYLFQWKGCILASS